MKKTHIMIHHSLTKDSGTVSWGAIERYHTKPKEEGGVYGFDDIGYHYGIEKAGSSYQALVGRPEQNNAAACKQGGMNRKAIHICCIGNYDVDEPPSEMLDVLVKRLINPIRDRYPMGVKGVGLGISKEKFNYWLVFHRDYASYKSCPGNNFTKEMLLERL